MRNHQGKDVDEDSNDMKPKKTTSSYYMYSGIFKHIQTASGVCFRIILIASGTLRTEGALSTCEHMGLSENVGYIPNEIAIFHRDNDQQNQWVQWGTQHFQTHPYSD